MRRVQAWVEPGAPRRFEARLRTGGAAHLVGGTLDFLQALLRYQLHRRGRARR